jgi:arsenite-transporting ATPase
MQQFDTLKLAMFSGKGGVGKTTLSCGFARRWAQRFPSEQILLISTDPAHSIGDVLQLEVSNTARAVPDLPNLSVRALDAGALLRSFKADYGDLLELLVERGSFVEKGDLTPVWDLNWPGLDELMGLLEIQRLLQQVDRIVVDMAPSGHTLALFSLMEFLEEFLAALELFQTKHQVISQTFAGRYTPDAVDRFLLDMKRDLTEGRALIQDETRSRCLVVAIAEWMSLLETQRFIHAIAALQIPFGGVFVNQLSTSDLVEKFRDLTPSLFLVPQCSQEPIGSMALDQLMAAVTQEKLALPAPAIQMPAPIPPGFEDFISAGRQLILVGGKGGVGKTTVASAIALGLAERHPDKNIRIISIDPAHSLGDALGWQLEHDPTQILDNLSAQEIDARQVLEQFRAQYLWELAEMMSGESGEGSLQVAYSPEAWRKIVSQALPGIDEMLALLTVIDLIESGEQDLIILDTAPTGHLLRFLEMPTALGDWLAWIFKLWIKYQNLLGRTELMGRLRRLRQQVMQAQQKLKDPQYTEFIGVYQARSTIIAETERLARSLGSLGIYQRYVVNNRCTIKQAGRLAEQAIVHLPALPSGLTPYHQIQTAAHLLFQEPFG